MYWIWQKEQFEPTTFCVGGHTNHLLLWIYLTSGISVGTGGSLMICASCFVEGRGLDSRAGTFLDFFCREICCTGVDLCCLSLIVAPWVGKLFLLSYCYNSLKPLKKYHTRLISKWGAFRGVKIIICTSGVDSGIHGMAWLMYLVGKQNSHMFHLLVNGKRIKRTRPLCIISSK